VACPGAVVSRVTVETPRPSRSRRTRRQRCPDRPAPATGLTTAATAFWRCVRDSRVKLFDILSYFSADKEGRPSLPTREQQELSDLAVERITQVVRSLTDDRVDRGVDLSRPMHCDSCNQERASAGSSLYGNYSLCNDCLLEFTLALASGSVATVDGFMTRPSDDEGPPPSDFDTRRDVPAASRSPLQGRDKLLPRNEPC
jgi:hypothetical protein